MALQNYFWKELHKGEVVTLVETQPGTIYLNDFSSLLGVQTASIGAGSIPEVDMQIVRREHLHGQAFLLMEDPWADNSGHIYMSVMHDGRVKTLFCPTTDRADWLKCS